MTVDSMQEAIQECDIYFQDANGVLEDAGNLRKTIKQYGHTFPLATRIASAANVLRDLEGQEANVRAQLRLCIRQLHKSVHDGRDRHKEQILAKTRMLYIELDRLQGLQEKAKTHVDGIRLERQSRVSFHENFQDGLLNLGSTILKALQRQSDAFSLKV